MTFCTSTLLVDLFSSLASEIDGKNENADKAHAEAVIVAIVFEIHGTPSLFCKHFQLSKNRILNQMQICILYLLN